MPGFWGMGVNKTDRSLTFMKLTSSRGKHNKLTSDNISGMRRTTIKIKQSEWTENDEGKWMGTV